MISSLLRVGLDTKVEDLTHQLHNMLNNHHDRPEFELELVFADESIPSKKIICHAYDSIFKVREKVGKLATTNEYRGLTAEVSEVSPGKVVAYINF